MEGIEFCKAWKQEPALASTPVIIISADAATAQKGAACGATSCLTKPVQLDRLLETVERCRPRP